MSISDWTESELILDAALKKAKPVYTPGDYEPALQPGEITDRSIAAHMKVSIHTAKRRRLAMLNAGVLEYSHECYVADIRGHLKTKCFVYRLITDAE